jgi:hypothetical protein
MISVTHKHGGDEVEVEEHDAGPLASGHLERRPSTTAHRS